MEEKKATTEKKFTDRELIYQLDGFPSLKVALPLGLQHVLAMFTGNLVPVFVLAGVLGLDDPSKIIMVQCAMFVSGLTTLFQVYPIGFKKSFLPRIGAGLPIVMGTSFAFVPTAKTVGAQYGLPGVLGGVLLGGLVEVVMAVFLKPLKRFFPPLVVGSVLIAIGVNLLTVGVNYFAGGVGSKDYGSPSNLLIGFSVFMVVMLLQRFGKGMWNASSLLIGVLAGYALSIALGKISFGIVGSAPWFSIPIPMRFGYEFHLDAVLAFASIYIVSGLETIGNTSGITVAAFDREATAEETSGAIMADAAGSMIASVFNTLPNTAFGQNAGIVAMTGVVNRWCIAVGAFVLIGAGLFPKIGAIFSVMPNSVLGGAVITVFAMIMINGIKLIGKAGFSHRNILVLAVTFGIGMGFGSTPAATVQMPAILRMIFHDSVSAVCIISIIANIVFPVDKDQVAVEMEVD
ncbi:MAG: purine permease [Synergistaceae bacterium]|nr:purine permease [Synergistaceae bacterium]MBP9626755.1 purine permease [Synergistaceae bacterium]MBP9958405.1 purine permease [Synergistaceae bacterium]